MEVGGLRVQLPFSYKYITASGVFVSKTGRILTARHVVEGRSLFRITTKSGRVFRSYLLDKSQETDIAILEPLNVLDTFSYVKIGNEPSIGDIVLCLGHPGGIMYNFTAGIVSSYRNNYLYSDVVINMGNSGGGLFDLSGKLVGITSAMIGPVNIPTYQGHSLFVRTSSIKKFLKTVPND